jgi:hypothetical protein
VAFHPYADIADYIFFIEEMPSYTDSDLQRLFGNSNTRIIWELQHRFDGLPIHRIVYYLSYNEEVLQGQTFRSPLDPTGNQQDCLGMTPLHILACSSVHNLELYRLIIEKYPTNLITEDRWGATPLLYAFWGAAPDEIIQFLLNSYQLFYPDHMFNWTMMVETMGRCDTPNENIKKLLHVKQLYFPEQLINWEYLLDKFANYSPHLTFYSTFGERLQFLVMCGMSLRVDALAFKVWRDHITHMIQTAAFRVNVDNVSIMRGIHAKVAHFEDEYPRLKEATTILELALWKMRMNVPQDDATHCLRPTTQECVDALPAELMLSSDMYCHILSLSLMKNCRKILYLSWQV